MSRTAIKPFLLTKDEEGRYTLTVRETRYNSQGYPLVTSTPVDGSFKSANAARAHAKEHYGAATGEFATK
jgi:hypothetical protein